MSRFRFRLDVLLRVGEARLAAARRDAQAAAHRLAEREAFADELDRHRKRAGSERERRLQNGLPAPELLELERRADALRPAENLARRTAEEAERERQRAMIELAAQTRKVRTLEELRRRARQRHRLHEARRLQKEADELHVLRRLHEEHTS